MTTPVLAGLGLTKNFGGTRALVNGHIEVFPGEVHAIVGENGAGKSTLMNVLAGVLQPDSGSISIDGEPIHFADPREALAAGVGIVHQELALCPDITVAENMFLSGPPRSRAGLIRFPEMNQVADRYLALFRTTVRPTDRVRDLPVGQQQVVEIARALANECRIVIFDEPTSSLTESESQALYAVIRDLRSHGVAVIYISHRMSEVFDLSDRVTVMRDGAWVETLMTDKTTPDEVVTMMVGRDLGGLYPPKARRVGDVALEVRGLSRGRDFHDVSFRAHYGEILGFSGLVGSGRSEVLRAATGIDPSESGEVEVDGERMTGRTFAQFIDRGVCYMTEDRKGDGLFLAMSIEANTIAAVLDRLTRYGMLLRSRTREVAAGYLEAMRTKMADIDQPVGALSGGNQQKVMIAKWLAANPRVLVLDEPTRGIDVGAKYDIHGLLRQLADGGMCVVVISSDLPEIVGLSDRVVVMREGATVGEVTGDDISEDLIIELASAARAA